MPEDATTHAVISGLFSPAGRAPSRLYRTIVADPPWTIKVMGFKKMGMKPALDYPTMTQAELINLPVGLWAKDKSHLYLWAPNSHIWEAHELVKAWGFTYSCLITWIKRRDERDGRMGLGRYYRVTTEHILFAVRGGLDCERNDEPNYFYAPRTGHSVKPSAFYDMVQRMSPGPYLDVFARKQRMNWDTWGDEAFDFRDHGIWRPEDGSLGPLFDGVQP